MISTHHSTVTLEDLLHHLNPLPVVNSGSIHHQKNTILSFGFAGVLALDNDHPRLSLQLIRRDSLPSPGTVAQSTPDKQILLGLVTLAKPEAGAFGPERLHQGDLFLIQDPFQNKDTQSKVANVYLISLQPEWLLSLIGKEPFSSSDLYRLPETPLSPFLRSMLRGLAQHAPRLSTAELTAILQSITLQIAVSLAALMHPVPPRKPRDADALFHEARAYMEEHYSHPELTLEVLASGIRSSRSAVYRAFSEKSTTFGDELRRIRFSHALKLLERSSSRTLKVDAVAYECGYSDLSAFTKAFKRFYGKTPGACRDGTEPIPEED